MEHFQDRANDGFDEEAPLAGNYEFATSGGADAPVPVVDMGVDDVPADAPEVVVSMVWKGQVLGFAFLAEAVLRFGEVSDTAPEYRMLQACKYTLKPDVIVCPSSSDQGWLHALSLSSLVVPGIALAADEEELQGAAIGEGGSGGSAGGPHVVRMKNRDFHADACAKRLSLLRALSELPKGTSEREVQMYLEHVCPREHEQARRAICGLLAYQQRADVGAAPLAVLGLQRYALESQLYMSPETFLSLHIFADERHPSAHGGRGKDGLSLWSIFNKTKTRFGEKLLRGWFARPTQDLDTLRERHDALEFLTAAPNAQLHAQLHGLVGKMKDISKIESSLSRGGLLLSDYTATLATASYAVKVAEMLLAAEVPQTLPFVRRALAAIDRELYMVSNTIASVIDFEASGAARSKAMVGGSHIVVREGVEALLDKLREEYAEITPVLDAVAAEERGRLARIGRLPPRGSSTSSTWRSSGSCCGCRCLRWTPPKPRRSIATTVSTRGSHFSSTTRRTPRKRPVTEHEAAAVAPAWAACAVRTGTASVRRARRSTSGTATSALASRTSRRKWFVISRSR